LESFEALVKGIGCHLEGQPGGREQALGLRDLLLAADERGQLGGEIVKALR
jgi:hypothetical protein